MAPLSAARAAAGRLRSILQYLQLLHAGIPPTSFPRPIRPPALPRMLHLLLPPSLNKTVDSSPLPRCRRARANLVEVRGTATGHCVSALAVRVGQLAGLMQSALCRASWEHTLIFFLTLLVWIRAGSLLTAPPANRPGLPPANIKALQHARYKPSRPSSLPLLICARPVPATKGIAIFRESAPRAPLAPSLLSSSLAPARHPAYHGNCTLICSYSFVHIDLCLRRPAQPAQLAATHANRPGLNPAKSKARRHHGKPHPLALLPYCPTPTPLFLPYNRSPPSTTQQSCQRAGRATLPARACVSAPNIVCAYAECHGAQCPHADLFLFYCPCWLVFSQARAARSRKRQPARACPGQKQGTAAPR